MDLRTRTMLLCAAFAIAITVAILLRSRKRKVHYLLAAFAANMALWYSAQWLLRFFQATVWYRLTAVLAVLLPQLALRLFAGLNPVQTNRPSHLLRVATTLGIPLLALAVSKWQAHPASRTLIFLYVFGLVAAGLADLFWQASRSPSRAIKDRLRLLATVGSLAVILSIGDFLWFIGAELPPVGAVLSVVFLFALAESMRRERLIDLYEMIGRLVVSTALAFCLAGIFYVFVTWVGFETMYLNAVLAAIAILLLFEPLRDKVEEKIHAIFFRQRHDLELAVQEVQERLVHVLEIDEMGEALIGALGRSRRFTAVALYLLEREGNAFALRKATSDTAPTRIEVATLRPILDCLRKMPSLVLENLGVAEQKTRDEACVDVAAIAAAAQVLGELQTSVMLPIRVPPGEVVGFVVVQDDRVRDAFTADEVAVIERIVPLTSVVVENTRAYARMKERDRLAALGQMAAGLAHEIKNPLGSIKGAAQFLLDGEELLPPASRDFLDIILEEVDRLDRVVGSALDYARPRKGDSAPLDANAVVRRTMQILGPASASAVNLELDLAEGLPRVRIDAEQLRQVLMNLVHNGLHAMGTRGTLTIGTRERRGRLAGWGATDVSRGWVEISVTDTGQGISDTILKNLFVPFFTTKTRGTGLGLAISQRIVQDAGGVIEVNTREGSGSTFRVVLPAVQEPETRESGRPPPLESEREIAPSERGTQSQE